MRCTTVSSGASLVPSAGIPVALALMVDSLSNVQARTESAPAGRGTGVRPARRGGTLAGRPGWRCGIGGSLVWRTTRWRASERGLHRTAYGRRPRLRDVSWSVWLTLVAAGALISLTPGAGAVNTMANSLGSGWTRSIWGILGQQVALVAHIVDRRRRGRGARGGLAGALQHHPVCRCRLPRLPRRAPVPFSCKGFHHRRSASRARGLDVPARAARQPHQPEGRRLLPRLHAAVHRDGPAAAAAVCRARRDRRRHRRHRHVVLLRGRGTRSRGGSPGASPGSGR